MQWAVEKLKAAYFDIDPAEILDIWLFKDKASYETNAKSSSTDARHALRLLLGGRQGLGDEHRHRRRHAGPRDRSSVRGGQLSRMSGLVQRGAGLALRTVRRGERRDPRLHQLAADAALQKAIREKRLPTFKTLCSTTTHEFYDDSAAPTTPRPATCAITFRKKVCWEVYRRFHANSEG